MTPVQATAGDVDELRPVVSVVIPTLNRERWLPRSIGSVQAQSFRDWELLVVDDGSTDGSAALLDTYAAADSRIQRLRNVRTKGVSGARNTAIDAARGEFIAFLDSDDEWLPEHLDLAINCLKTEEEDVDVFSGAAERRRFPGGERYEDCSSEATRSAEIRIMTGCDVYDCILSGGGILTTQSLVIRRSLLQNSVLFPEDFRLGEDFLFQLSLALACRRVAVSPRPHVVYWAHSDNTCNAGGGDIAPDRRIQLSLSFLQVQERILRDYPLTLTQRKRLIKESATLRFWHLGYAGWAAAGNHRKARREYWRAIWLMPTNVSFWRTVTMDYFRQFYETVRATRRSR